METIQIIIEQINKGEAIGPMASALKDVEVAEKKVTEATGNLNKALEKNNGVTVAAHLRELTTAHNGLTAAQDKLNAATGRAPTALEQFNK